MDDHQETVELPARIESIREARRFVVSVVGPMDADSREQIELLVSEVVSNAVLHAATDIRITVTCLENGTVRVEVADRSPAAPTMRDPELTARSGRGLRIVDSLASRWGTEQVGDGKVVWFELGVTEPA